MRTCVVYQNHASLSFRIRWCVRQASVHIPVLLFLSINDLPASLPSSISCSLYTDDPALWPSYPSMPVAVEATQEALIRLDCWSHYCCFPLNPSKREVSIFSMDRHQANFQLHPLLVISPPPSVSIPPIFHGVTFDCSHSFSKHVSSLKAKFFLVSRFYDVSLLPHEVL